MNLKPEREQEVQTLAARPVQSRERKNMISLPRWIRDTEMHVG
jgi:hypothetical protein